jgi:hypothetical protein
VGQARQRASRDLEDVVAWLAQQMVPRRRSPACGSVGLKLVMEPIFETDFYPASHG